MKQNIVMVVFLVVVAGLAVWYFVKKAPQEVAKAQTKTDTGDMPVQDVEDYLKQATVPDITGTGMVLVRDPSETQPNAWIFAKDVPAYISGGWVIA